MSFLWGCIFKFQGLIYVVLQFYNPEEISAAKVTLWDAYGAEALGATMARQDSLNRAAHEAEIDDIMDAVMKLDAEVDSDVVQVQFVAYDLGRLPRTRGSRGDGSDLIGYAYHTART